MSREVWLVKDIAVAMSISRYICLNDEENSQLQSCWIAGKRNWRAAEMTKATIESINVVHSCNMVENLINNMREIDENRNTRCVFYDITCLAFGLAKIVDLQASMLVADAEQLLFRMAQFELPSSLKSTKENTQTQLRIKRKRTLKRKQSTTIVKRARTEDSLDETIDYLLNKSQHLLIVEESVETQMFDVDQHNITRSSVNIITEETELHTADIMMNEGFGEKDGYINLTDFQDLFRNSNKLKRQSDSVIPTDILPSKMTRMDESFSTSMSVPECIEVPRSHEISLLTADDLMQNANNLGITSPSPNIETPNISINPSSSAITKRNLRSSTPIISISRQVSKHNLIVDKETFLSVKTLLTHRHSYITLIEQNMGPIKLPGSYKKGQDLLKTFRLSRLFPDALKLRSKQDEDQQEIDAEYTLRHILGEGYNEHVARDVFAKDLHKEVIVNPFDVSVMPSVEVKTEEISQDKQCENNNETSVSDDDKIDDHKVMSLMLHMSDTNEYGHIIKAKKFLNIFSNRVKAASAFYQLLDLAKRGIIEIETKSQSLEMNNINLKANSIYIVDPMAQQI